MKENNIAFSLVEFAKYPGPRYSHQGENSGEDFYYKKLRALFKKVLRLSEEKNSTVKLIINLDDTNGYASSFLDECFGLLASHFGKKLLKKHLKIISNQEPDWIDMIQKETIPRWHKKKEDGVSPRPDHV